MKFKWFFALLVVGLAVYGIQLQQPVPIPNQEILLQFSQTSVSSDRLGEAVTEIADQLEDIGVEQVQVHQLSSGQVKISYYSTIEAGVVRSLLYKQNKLTLEGNTLNDPENSSDFPSSDKPEVYKIEVLKIHNDYESGFGSNGTLVETKSITDQYLKPKFSVTTAEIRQYYQSIREWRPSVFPYNFQFANTAYSYKIPEVRAGPLC